MILFPTTLYLRRNYQHHLAIMGSFLLLLHAPCANSQLELFKRYTIYCINCSDDDDLSRLLRMYYIPKSSSNAFSKPSYFHAIRIALSKYLVLRCFFTLYITDNCHNQAGSLAHCCVTKQQLQQCWWKSNYKKQSPYFSSFFSQQEITMSDFK